MNGYQVRKRQSSGNSQSGLGARTGSSWELDWESYQSIDGEWGSSDPPDGNTWYRSPSRSPRRPPPLADCRVPTTPRGRPQRSGGERGDREPGVMSGLRKFSIVEDYAQRKSEKYGTDWQPNNTATTCMICDKVRPPECEFARRHPRGADGWCTLRPPGRPPTWPRPPVAESQVHCKRVSRWIGPPRRTHACACHAPVRPPLAAPPTLPLTTAPCSTQGWSLTRRRHHCRMCGSLVCGCCSSHKIKLESSTNKKRVCSTCFARQALGHIAHQVAERPRPSLVFHSGSTPVPLGFL